MKKRAFLSIFLALALTVGFVPAKAAELPAPEGLSITWYTDYEGLMRRYGTDRMLLVKGGKSGLFGLDGTKYTDCIFDAFGTFNGSGLAPACLNGKWGMVDLDGKTVVDFTYDGQYEAEVQAATYPTFKGKGGKDEPPYALFAPDGKQLTGYDFWAYKPFVNRFARVTNGELYAYIGVDGQLITPYIYTDEAKDFGADGYAIVHEYSIGYNLINVRGEKLLPQGYTSFNRHPWDAGFGIWGYLDADGIVFVDLATGKRVNERAFVNAFDMGKSWPSGYQFNADGIMSVVLNEDGERRYYLMDTNGNLTAVERDSETGLPVDPAMGETYLPSSGPKSSQETDGWYEGLKWVNYKGESAFAGDRDGPWGFMDKSGTLVVPAVFDAVGYFDRGVAVVKSGDAFGLLKNPLGGADEAHKVSDWAAAEVAAARSAGYVTPSCGTYQTYTITRAQFAELAVNYVEKKTGKAIDPAPADTFTDTADETILKACAAGIVRGMGDGTFSPGSPLTREQLATMLWRAMEKVGVTAEKADLSAYADAYEVSDWAADSLAALVGLEVMAGTSETTLSPKNSCTVEQAILLVYRAAN